MMPRRAKVELEPARETTTTASRSAAGEELREGIATATEASSREPALEGIATLAGHGVIRIVTVVEALPQLRVGEHLVRFVHGSHLGLGAAFIWMRFHGCFPAVDEG
jgi:hypothetical protein